MKRALISVFDKTGIVEFAIELAKLKVEILSTGGTAKKLKDAGIKAKVIIGGAPDPPGARSSAALYLEAFRFPNMVDHNFIWAWQGPGIHMRESNNTIIAHNMICKCTGAAIRTTCDKDRIIDGKAAITRYNKVLNNIFFENGSMIGFNEEPENVSDYNIFAGSIEPFDLESWRENGWERHSVRADFNVVFNPKKMELTWFSEDTVPEFPLVEFCNRDFLMD